MYVCTPHETFFILIFILIALGVQCTARAIKSSLLLKSVVEGKSLCTYAPPKLWVWSKLSTHFVHALRADALICPGLWIPKLGNYDIGTYVILHNQ